MLQPIRQLLKFDLVLLEPLFDSGDGVLLLLKRLPLLLGGFLSTGRNSCRCVKSAAAITITSGMFSFCVPTSLSFCWASCDRDRVVGSSSVPLSLLFGLWPQRIRRPGL
jgi:hypothetical protein